MIRPGALLLALALPLVAQASRFRDIQPTGKGPQRLEVDLALLGGARSDLGDLRLINNGRELPYVLVPPLPGEPQWKTGRVLPLPQTKETSGLELDLGASTRTSRLELDGLKAPFLKRYRLEGSGDRLRWTELLAQGSLFDLPTEELRLLRVDFPLGDYRYLRLTWDDRSSARLALPRNASVQVEGLGGAVPSQESLVFGTRPSETGSSRFRVRLPGPHLPIRALLLDVGGQGPLLREVTVLESRLEAHGLSPKVLGRGTLRRTERYGVLASDLRIPIESPEGAELDLKVENGNNAPLELRGLKAEFPSQPWIYFESPTNGPLRASYGNPNLPGPRYDLEAMREQLRGARVARASWGAAPSTEEAIASSPANLDPGLGTALDQRGFRFQRTLPQGSRGLSALVLDAHVLAHSRTLADLRLLDREQHQIPYLLEKRDEPLVLPLVLPKGVFQNKISAYVLELPQAELPPARLLLETGARVFQRAIRVREDRGEGQSRILVETLWQHRDPELAAPALVLALPPLEGRRVTLEVEEGDNPPLLLREAKCLLPTWRLRFFHPGKELNLCYGREMEEPRYDIGLLAERLRLEPVRELTLSPEGTEPPPERSPAFAKVFWGVLAIAVFALLGVLMRLLKKVPR
ncbi:MAG: hypothetical protein H6Q00_448 [Holophagaceae bacterium]|nr:hypothetical protein [Holophagaceae bacterium]